MLRAQFEKSGSAIWISHLDLMRMFQRAFQRAGLPLTHTQGYNPRPSVAIALPMPVGMESKCELLDFALEGKAIPCDEICRRLNDALISGIRVTQVYDDGRKLKELAWLECAVTLEYDAGVAPGTIPALQALFARESVIVDKKSKSGIAPQDIIPLLRNVGIEQTDEQSVCVRARVHCCDPVLSPMQLPAAVRRYLPEHAPDFARCCRLALYDKFDQIFR